MCLRMSSSIPWLYPVEVTRSYPSLHCDNRECLQAGVGQRTGERGSGGPPTFSFLILFVVTLVLALLWTWPNAWGTKSPQLRATEMEGFLPVGGKEEAAGSLPRARRSFRQLGTSRCPLLRPRITFMWLQDTEPGNSGAWRPVRTRVDILITRLLGTIDLRGATSEGQCWKV